MKKYAVILIVIIILLPLVCLANTDAKKTQTGQEPAHYGSMIGGGFSLYSYTTSWYWYNPYDLVGSREHYPVHKYFRPQFSGFYERQSLFKIGSVTIDIRGEILFGFFGGTKEDWLPDGETISSGGISLGTAGIVKAAYPLIFQSWVIAPFAGIGFQYSLLTSNGENVGTNYANRTDYDYASGWSENVFGLVLCAGVNIELKKFVIIPEFRFTVLTGATTSWEPVGYAPENEGAGLIDFRVGVGFRL